MVPEHEEKIIWTQEIHYQWLDDWCISQYTGEDSWKDNIFYNTTYI